MKILLAVDDSLCAEAMVDFVLAHSWPPKAEFKILNVTEAHGTDALLSFLPPPVRDGVAEEMEAAGRHLVRHVALRLRDAFHSTHVEEEVVKGNAREQIVRSAAAWGADLIVLASRCLSRPGGWSLGSVSMAVTASAPCSVVVLKVARVPEQLIESAHVVSRRACREGTVGHR